MAKSASDWIISVNVYGAFSFKGTTGPLPKVELVETFVVVLCVCVCLLAWLLA